MTPIWISSAVSAFGRRMGLSSFALNERDVASATFENGISVAFEFANESLCVSLRVPVTPSPMVLKKLLVSAHPSNRFPFRLRTAYVAKSGRALFIVRLAERQVTDAVLDQVFSGLWQLARGLEGEGR